MQPGQTINPGNTPDDKPEEPTETPVAETPQATDNSEQIMEGSSDTAPDSQADWQYNADDSPQIDRPIPHDVPTVTWTASEFIDHDKRASWFLGLAGITVVACIIIYLITHDRIATVMIVIATALFGVTAGRKPSTLEYRLDASGIKIGNKLYEYSRFKSFSVIEEGALDSIQLTPLARLVPPISLYYPPDQEEQIVGTLANYLPHEDRRHDPVDRLMRRIRF